MGVTFLSGFSRVDLNSKRLIPFKGVHKDSEEGLAHMAIENVYSYLEYLALTVDQLADAVIEREEESAVYEARIQELSEALAYAQSLQSQPQQASVNEEAEARIQAAIDQAEARIQLAEARAAQAEAKAEEFAVMLKAAKQKKTVQNAQIDMFAAPFAPPPAPVAQQPVATKSNKVANDENALILAKKLDSTIDKVQRLIREARA